MSRPSSRTTDRATPHHHQPPHSPHSRSSSRRSSTANPSASHDHHPPDPYAFCNSFWGESGYEVLQAKNRHSSRMLDDLRVWYKERAAVEDDYAKRLAKLAKSPLLDGAEEFEVGGLRKALDVVRNTTRQSAHSHAELAGTVRAALEKKVADFVIRREALKKNPSSQIERLHKKKTDLMAITEKSRRKYEADAIAVNGLSAQTHLVQGRDLDKVSAKLDKAQQHVQINEREYRSHVKNLQETTAEWNVQWKAYCDLAQDLEEDRMDFIRTSFWDYANGVSTICVVDDEQCENIRKALERCETSHDVVEFVRHSRTGNDIYVAPDYINYARGEQAPYRPQSVQANFARSSARNPRVAPSTTSIQDLAQAIRSGPASPTDPIYPASFQPSPSKATVKRGGAIADAVAANSFTGDTSSGLVPRPSLSRASLGGSISRAASPAEAMAQVLGGSNNPGTANGHQAPSTRSNGSPVLPARGYTPRPNASGIDAAGQDVETYSADQTPPAIKPVNRYMPKSNPEPPKHYPSQPALSSSQGASNAQPVARLPPPSNRPASRASTVSSIQPPSIPSESGAVDPLVVALEKLRSTPSIGSFRRSPVPANSPARPRNGTASSTSHRGTLEQPPTNDQYKRASSPAPSAVMMKPPADMRSTGARTPSPQHGSYMRSRAASPAPSSHFSGASPSPYPSHTLQQSQQPPQHHGRSHSYVGQSSGGAPLGQSAQGSHRMDSTDSSSGLASKSSHLGHQHSRSQPTPTMMASPASYNGQGQLPFRQAHQPPTQPPQQHPPPVSQPGYAPRPSQHYGYAPPAASQPPLSTTPAPIQSYAPQGHLSNTQSQYSMPPPQSFLPQQPYYGGRATTPQNPTPVHAQANSGPGVGMYGGENQQQTYYSTPHPTQQPSRPPSSQPNKVPSPTGNYTESGLPILFYVRALYDYTATLPEEFSFQANDVIAITQTDPDGWWQGELLDEFRRRNGGGGNVLPSNFVDLLN